MDLAVSLLFVYLVMLGLGAWLPVPAPGVRLMAGGALVPIAMHSGAVGGGLPLSWLGWTLTGIAAGGLVFCYRRGRRWDASKLLREVRHPVYVLPALIAAVALAHGDIPYVPYGQDEFTSWMYWPRQQFVADAVWRADMAWNIKGYMQGWPLSIVFAQTAWDEFSGVRGIAVAAMWHVGLLGVAYDLIDERLRGEDMAAGQAAALAWSVVGLMLAAEADGSAA